MSWFDTIYADETLPHRAVTVYMYLRDRSGRKGACWPGIKTVASDLSLSKTTVKRALRELESRGYLRKTARYRDNGSRTSNLYEVVPEPRPPPG